MPEGRCSRLCLWEFHRSRFCLAHNDWRAFAFTPWLPYKWQYQIIYLVYRWVVALYFHTWLLLTEINQNSPKFFIFVTNWAFIVFNIHLLHAALSTTVDHCKAYLCGRQHYNQLILERDADEFEIVKPKGCFDSEHNQLKWYHMIYWVLFTLGTQGAVTVVILYWIFLYEDDDFNVYDIHYHLGNGIVGLIDALVSGLPIRFLHFYMPQLFSAVYVSFTGIYYAAGGTGYNGTSYIYPPLDYDNNPGQATGLSIGIVIFQPVIHFMFYGLYLTRYWLVYLLYGRRHTKRRTSCVPLASLD